MKLVASMEFDKEEQELLGSFENGEWVRVANPEAAHQQYARNTLKKDKRVNIRLSSKDLEELQVAAVRQRHSVSNPNGEHPAPLRSRQPD